jgi:hypothetical protein
VLSGSSAIQVTQNGESQVSLRSTSVIPAGKVITLEPTDYPTSTQTALVLSIRGYGGSASSSFQTEDGQLPHC